MAKKQSDEPGTKKAKVLSFPRRRKTSRKKARPSPVEDKKKVENDQEPNRFGFDGGRLDLNRHLVKNAAATFYVRVTGDSMSGAGIQTDDILVVDRSEPTHDGDIIIAIVNDELCVKRLRMRGERVELLPENPEYDPIEITPSMKFEVWGKVLHLIHAFQKEEDEQEADEWPDILKG
jgi:DNA polymerase V